MGLALSLSFSRQMKELWLIPRKRGDLTPLLYQKCKKIHPGEVSRCVGSEAVHGPSPHPMSLNACAKPQ